MSEYKNSAKEVCFCFPTSKKHFSYDFKMALEIKNIRERLEDIKGDRGFYLDECRVENSLRIREREQTHSSLPEIVIGREDDKTAILDILLCSNQEKNLSVISIVGIGGLAENGPSLEPVAGLGELNGLNNMRGELIIRNFRYVIKDGVSEFRAANLEEKQYLQSLRLEWVIDPFSEPYSGAAFDYCG
ncbi:hypothetical protein GH714_000616 [Hevea brasiliensis]|uniref:R13L1/DRL21-like LRR repeat region domain-containing protein n=1 Tax=Hevea brasiliensis TaxID=3981 RepID=A0A6A6KEV3_HEVBR|nr:hypothetical protein GH714_000616 [Hevea brasiliensis]